MASLSVAIQVTQTSIKLLHSTAYVMIEWTLDVDLVLHSSYPFRNSNFRLTCFLAYTLDTLNHSLHNSQNN